MKTAFKISLWLNLGLFSALIFLVKHSPKPKVVLPVMTVSEVQSPLPKTTVLPRSQSKPVAFRWCDLISTNGYLDYVANLRAIGCPEFTIRAIVEADVRDALAANRRESNQESGQPKTASQPEEAQLVNKLLGQKAAAVDSANLSQNPSPQRQQQQWTTVTDNASPQTSAAGISATPHQTVVAQYPLVYKDVVMNDRTLNQDQVAAVNQVQEKFVDDIGGMNQDSTTPDYLQKWQVAQQDADDELRGLIGNQAYMGYLQQHYYSNYQQVVLSAGDGPIVINPTALMR